jgi:FKBP-type peptidyl-prolyl cis-trans isomerase FklB
MIMRIGQKQILAAGLVLTGLQLAAWGADPSGLPDSRTKASYAAGMKFGEMIKSSPMDLDLDMVVGAMKDVMAGRALKLDDQQMEAALRAYAQESVTKTIEKNKKDGEAFLAENKTKAGVKTKTITLAGGGTAELQYKVLTDGTGPLPGTNDLATVSVRGRLLDGREFENRQQGKLSMNRIPFRGWSEALQMMKIGSEWELYLPASLAYGDQGNGQSIPRVEPGAAVVYVMKLLSSETPPPPPPPQQPPQPLTSDIIKVPSADELKKGAKIEVIKPEDVQKEIEKQAQGQPGKK